MLHSNERDLKNSSHPLSSCLCYQGRSQLRLVKDAKKQLSCILILSELLLDSLQAWSKLLKMQSEWDNHLPDCQSHFPGKNVHVDCEEIILWWVSFTATHSIGLCAFPSMIHIEPQAWLWALTPLLMIPVHSSFLRKAPLSSVAEQTWPWTDAPAKILSTGLRILLTFPPVLESRQTSFTHFVVMERERTGTLLAQAGTAALLMFVVVSCFTSSFTRCFEVRRALASFSTLRFVNTDGFLLCFYL